MLSLDKKTEKAPRRKLPSIGALLRYLLAAAYVGCGVIGAVLCATTLIYGCFYLALNPGYDGDGGIVMGLHLASYGFLCIAFVGWFIDDMLNG